MAGWFVDRTGWTGTLETQTAAAGVRTSENTKTACAKCWKGKSELIKLSGSPFHCLLPSFGVTYSRCQTKQGKPGVSWEQIWEDRDKRGRHHQSMKWMKICNVTKIDEDICIFFSDLRYFLTEVSNKLGGDLSWVMNRLHIRVRVSSFC